MPPTSSEEVLFVPAAWTTPAPGYWMTEQAGRDVFAGWSSDRAERDYLSGALEAQFERAETFSGAMARRLSETEADLAKALAKERRRPGLILGVGVSHKGEIRGIAGIGWKF